jgi:conjugal transfer mating pair stabilization protein TraG
MSHVITTYGGGELFFLVFNGIAALFRTDRTGLVMSLIRVGLTVGSVYVVILMLFKNQVIEGFKWFLWVLVATNLLFLPKTTIWIHDPLCNTKKKIDHVPFALGAFASLVSQVGRAITEQFEAVFTLPDYMPYHQTGTVFASSLMSQMGQFRIVDPVFKGNMERFVNQCVVYDAMIGHKYTLTDLQNTPDIWGLVTQNASPVLGFLYKQDNDPGTVVTCKQGATILSKLWANQIARATALYGSRVNNRTLTANAFNSELLSGAKLLSGSMAIANSATDLLRQEMMINAIEEASNNKLSELGSASNYAATKALLQQRSAYAAAGEIAARTLPLFKNVIEALSYALFIFIVILALLPNGYRTVLTYCGILAWTQLWAPLYAVLNLIMTLYGKHESMSHGLQNGLTLLNSSAVINANADMVTLAAWLSVSIPFISYGILKQGAAAFVGLAQHLGSAMQSAASSAAAETVSGNISMGNVSMGTQAYQNTSAFQHNTSPSYTTSQFKAMNSSGVEQSTFGTGAQAFNDQALSRLSVQIMGSENTSYAIQDHLNHANNVLKSTSQAASQATDAALSETSNFLSSVGKAMSSGEDFHKSVSASEAKSLQNFKNYVNDIQQSTGLNEAQAFEAAVGASSGALQLVGIDIRGGFSSSAARNEAIQAAQSIAKQTNYSDSLDKVVSAAQSFSEAHNDTKNAELGRSAVASLNQAKSLREETSMAQNQVDTLSKDISTSHGKSLSINKDLTQSVLEYIAHQPVNAGPNGVSGQVGHERARQILENVGAERDAYLKRFQEENPRYKIQSINASKEEAALASKFESGISQIKSPNDMTAQYQHNRDNILRQGMQENLYPGRVPTSIKDIVSSSIEDRGTKIDQGKATINRHETDLQRAEKEANDRSLAGSVLSNSLASITPDTTATFQRLAEKDPTYKQFLADQQKEPKDQLLGSTSTLALLSPKARN